MLMSTIAAPTSTAIPAARASASGSRPKICTAKRRPPKLGHIRPSALAAPRVSASADRNSVKVSAAPSSSQIVRNGRSVTASIGASRAPGLISTSPMRMASRQHSIAVAATLATLTAAGSCRRAPRRRRARRAGRAATPPDRGSSVERRGAARRRRRPLDAGARAAAGRATATRRSRTSAPTSALRPGDPKSPLVNTNAHYWTTLAGLAWDRDVDIDFDGEPVDLDGDGTRGHEGHPPRPRQGGHPREPRAVRPHAHARRSARARRDASPRRPACSGCARRCAPTARRRGEIGMTCWLCHGRREPRGRQDRPRPAGRGVRLRPAARDRRGARRRERRGGGVPPRARVSARVAPSARGCCSPDRGARISPASSAST